VERETKQISGSTQTDVAVGNETALGPDSRAQSTQYNNDANSNGRNPNLHTDVSSAGKTPG